MKKILVLLATITICAVAVLTTNSFAEATGNLWRCTRCNVQIQTSDTSKPRPGKDLDFVGGDNFFDGELRHVV